MQARDSVSWRKAQELAGASFRAPETQWQGLLKQAWQAVWACAEPYKRVAVAAWPVSAEVKRTGRFSSKLALQLLSESQLIENTGSRVEALWLLWQALSPLGPSERATVEKALIEAGLNSVSWRGAACLRELALAVEPEVGLSIAKALPEGRIRRQIFREIASGKRMPARTFLFGP